jgi:hypothetical protein
MAQSYAVVVGLSTEPFNLHFACFKAAGNQTTLLTKQHVLAAWEYCENENHVQSQRLKYSSHVPPLEFERRRKFDL